MFQEYDGKRDVGQDEIYSTLEAAMDKAQEYYDSLTKKEREVLLWFNVIEIYGTEQDFEEYEAGEANALTYGNIIKDWMS